MNDPKERPPIAGAPLSVVLPAYEATPWLYPVLRSWIDVLDGLQRPYELIVVDDGSRDGTGQLLGAWGQHARALRVYSHAERRGFGTALRTGIAAAQYPLLCYAPLDRQYEPADLLRMLKSIDEADVVCGYRTHQHVPVWYRLGHGTLRVLTAVLFGIPLEPPHCWLGGELWGWRWLGRWLFALNEQDPFCAMRLLRRELFARLPIQSHSSLVSLEILAKGTFLGAWRADEALSYHPPQAGVANVVDPPQGRDFRQLWHAPSFHPGPQAQPAGSRS